MHDVHDVHDVHEVAAVHVHDVQHTDIERQHEVRQGQQFVRLLLSKCVIKFDDEDREIPESVRAMTGTARALDTEAAQNACAVHAVFGAPSHNGKLAVPHARQFALTLLSQARSEASSFANVHRRLHLLAQTFWNESCCDISEVSQL